MQYPSLRECDIHKTARIHANCNLVRVTMGKNSYMGNNNSVMDTNIGHYCSIASYCAIGGGNHPTEWVSSSPYFYNYNDQQSGKKASNFFNSGEKVNIGNDVWIGENCFIKSGITIGNGAIIGAHSVVTSNIPDYAIAVGVPAKIIKYRFEFDIIEELLKIEWWNFSESELAEYSELFNNPVMFINRYKEKIKSLENN